MEDQPADTRDLADEPATAPADAAATAEDSTAGPEADAVADVTATSGADSAGSPPKDAPAAGWRRWFGRRAGSGRRPVAQSAPAPSTDEPRSEPETPPSPSAQPSDSAAGTPAAKTPVGKRRRGAAPATATPAAPSEDTPESAAPSEDTSESAAPSEDTPDSVAAEQDTSESAAAEQDAGDEHDDATAATSPPAEDGQESSHRPIGKPLAASAAAAAVLFVAAAAFAAAMLQPYLADRALVDTKLDIARTAANAITSLWTYTPDDMEDLPDRSAQYLGGDLQDQYRSFIDAIAPSNKQAQVTNSTQVMGAAVESLTGNDATAIVYTNTVSTSPASNNIPSLKYMSYQLGLQRRGTDWLVTRMTPITTLDITPRVG